MKIDIRQAKEIWKDECETDKPITFNEWAKKNKDNYDITHDCGYDGYSDRFCGGCGTDLYPDCS